MFFRPSRFPSPSSPSVAIDRFFHPFVSIQVFFLDRFVGTFDFFVNNISFENLKRKKGIMKKEVFGVIYDFLYCRKNLG